MDTATMPVDAIAWMLRKMGLPIPDDPVMGEEWAKRVGLIQQPSNRGIGLLGDMVGTVGQAALIPPKGLLGGFHAKQ